MYYLHCTHTLPLLPFHNYINFHCHHCTLQTSHHHHCIPYISQYLRIIHTMHTIYITSLYNPSTFHLPPTTLQGSELISKRVLPPSDNVDSPVLSFVALEHYNAVRLAQTIHSNLAALNRVLRGSSLLTPSVQQLARALLQHEVLM